MFPLKIDVGRAAEKYGVSLDEMHRRIQTYFMEKHGVRWRKQAELSEFSAKLVWQTSYPYLYIASNLSFIIGDGKDFFDACEVDEYEYEEKT